MENTQELFKVKDLGYWSNTGNFQKEFDILEDRYIPDYGESIDKPYGELLRMSTRLAYEWYNNGWGNDKREELEYLNKFENLFSNYLQNPDSFKELYILWYNEVGKEYDKNYIYDLDDDDGFFHNNLNNFDKEINLWINDLIDAIVQSIIDLK